MEWPSIIELATAVVSVCGTIVGSVAFAVRWWAAFVKRMENERVAALAQVREQAALESSRCHEQSTLLGKQLEALRDRMEAYAREDQSRIMTVLDRNAEAFANSTRAYDRLTDHLNTRH